MPHIYWTWKSGEQGQTRRGRLLDASGGVDLTQFDSVTVTAKKTITSDPVIDAETVVPDADQTINTGTSNESLAASVGCGWFTYTISTAAGTADVNKHGYLLEFRGMVGLTPYYFPKDKNGDQTYGRIYVQEPLSA